MEEFGKLFPFDGEVKINKQKREQGSELLMKCKEDIENALEYIRDSITDFA